MPSHANLARSTPEASWPLPKVTPFRLAFIFTTGGLGITKAVLVAKGSTTSSITVEWITGVIVALVFQLLGSCEYNSARPRILDSIFCYDCLGRSSAATTVGERRLAPNALELQASTTPSSSHPQSTTIVTGYRLLVSIVCTVFGLVKMICGYLSLSSAMNTLDWVIATPLTLGLYCFGLYEDHSVRSLRRLFEVDYSSQAVFTAQMAFLGALYLSSVVFCCYWDISWFKRLRGAIAYSGSAQWDEDRESFMWVNIYLRMVLWRDVLVASVMLSAGVLGLGALIWPIINVCIGRYGGYIRTGGLWMAAITFFAFFLIIGSSYVLVVISIISLIHNLVIA